MPLAGLGASLGISLLHKKDNEGAFKMTEGFVYTFLATHALKILVGEKRPNGSNNASFPSGHTSASFQAAEFLQLRYGYKYGIPAFTLATLVGYSRVKAKEHYWHDVIAGAMLGIGFAYMVQRTKHSLYNVFFSPVISNNSVGFLLSMNFNS